MENIKTTESRCRRALAKYGYALHKNRKRTGWNAGGYMILNGYNNTVAAGGDFELDLDDVVSWCAELEKEDA
jgi:hypothetical protein